MSVALAEMTTGFQDAVHGAQRVFRSVLDAMSFPGRVMDLPAAAIDGIEPPASLRPMSLGTAALLLTLLDAETSVRLVGDMSGVDALNYLRFHTGVRAARSDETAAFTVAHAADVFTTVWRRLDLGTDEVPQLGATFFVEVDELHEAGGDDDDATGLRLEGPGIETHRRLYVRGLSRDFWQWRIELGRLMPRGIEIVLIDGVRIAAIPRSTRIELEG
jgi:alpha-D-ribose 1-methylphosphonate 5-triphosphate synthase subunit PhnH